MARRSSTTPEPPATQYVSDPDDSAELFEVLEILDERGNRGVGDYLVQWSGNDPATGEPWEPSWAKKSGCTQGLIDEWKEKKKANPNIVGVERRKLEEREVQRRQAALEEKKINKEGLKRKRDTKSRFKSVIASKKSRVGSKSTAPESRNQNSSLTPSSTPDPEPARATSHTRSGSKSISISPGVIKRSPKATFAVPASRATRAPGTRAGNTSASTSVEPAEQQVQISSPQAPDRGKKLSGRKSIPLGPARPMAGPGPTTIENRAKESITTPIRSNAAVGIDATSSTRSHLTNGGPSSARTRTTRSAFESQIDPIGQFSSPSQNAGKGRGHEDDRVQQSNPPSGPDETQSDVPMNDDSYEIKGESIDIEVNSAKFERRIIDGEEVLVAVSESVEDDEAEEVQKASMPALVEIEDEDLAGLSSGDLDQSFDRQIAALDDQPENVAPRPPAGPPSSKPPGTSQEEQSAKIAELEKEIQRIQAQLQLDEVGRLRAENEHLKTQFDSSDSAQLRSEIVTLQKQLGEATQLRTVVNNLSDRPAEMTALRVEISDLKDQLREAESLRIENDELKRKVDQGPILSVKIEDLETRLRSAERSRKDLLDETSFLRSQYSQARDRAVEEVNVAKSLREQSKTLKEQLSFGLKQRDLHQGAITKRREEEMAKLRAQNKMLLDQSRLTDDLVRKRAALFPRLKEENEELVTALSKEQSKNEALELRNEDLRTQFEEMRARQMGLLDGNEDDTEDDSYDSEDSSPSGNRVASKSPAKRQSRPARQPNQSSLVAAREASASTEDQSRVEEILPAGDQYPCKWFAGDEPCRAVFDTIEEVAEHARIHQEYDLISGAAPRYATSSITNPS